MLARDELGSALGGPAPPPAVRIDGLGTDAHVAQRIDRRFAAPSVEHGDLDEIGRVVLQLRGAPEQAHAETLAELRRPGFRGPGMRPAALPPGSTSGSIRPMADLLRHRPSGPHRLRALLAQPGPVLAPGAYDALSARLVERAGFDVVYMTGFGTAASLLGRPDVGLLGLAEMVDNVRRIVHAVDVPVIADADTGYGNAINVVRTVQEYEQAGVAGLHIEDQVLPKRCGHMSG